MEDDPNPDSLFAAFDRDGNQSLEFEEFVAMQPTRVRETSSIQEIRSWFDAADEDKSGLLSINEFFKWSISKSEHGDGASILEQAFKQYDRDRGGTLGYTEFKQLARDMGFGELAAEAFAVLDADGSGSISYAEMLQQLRTSVPRNMATKKLLFGCIWSWGAEKKEMAAQRPSLDTSGWHIRGRDAETVREELRKYLTESGAHVIDLVKLFDEDVGGLLEIDEGEFMKALQRWGYRGLPSVVDEVFASLNTGGTAKIDYDELFEFVRGHRHALDARERNAMVRELTVDVPPNSPFTLADVAWDVEPSARESVESLRILVQNMLITHNVGPDDLMRAWDRSGDKQLDKREFVTNVRRLFRQHSALWKRELHRVADAAFVEIQNDGSDVNSSQMDIIELEQWLEPKTRRRMHLVRQGAHKDFL